MNNIIQFLINPDMTAKYLIAGSALVCYYYSQKGKKNVKNMWKYVNNISTSHAIIISTICSLYLNNNISPNFLSNGLAISMGYMINDTNTLWKYKMSFRRVYTVHHIIVILGEIIVISNINNKLYSTLLAWGLLSEISTIFLNDCHKLVKGKREKSLRFLISSTLLLATYTYFRIGTFTWISNIVYNTSKLHKFIPLVFTITGMNYLWYGVLCKKYVRSWINYVEDGQIVSDPVIENDNDYDNDNEIENKIENYNN